ncbi:COG3023 Negative regulator of beta-lactamase expression [Vibrio sp. B1FLJ16]|nr:COG3023 Negative regulator of beta-lactamase expression [Vibrio sp. B1FLJ16]CAE6916596.1 COG3023 Negative regulator of beta-lactamase expression [Vibrio sp. B1FLJ16]
MCLKIENGWLTQAKHVPSPFFDARSDKEDISLLVVHNISLPPGQFGGSYIEDFFQGKLDPTAHPFLKLFTKWEFRHTA